jgi:hypothetical protein
MQLQSQLDQIVDKSLEARNASGAKRANLEADIESLRARYKQGRDEYSESCRSFNARVNKFKEDVAALKGTESAGKDTVGSNNDSMSRWREPPRTEVRQQTGEVQSQNSESLVGTSWTDDSVTRYHVVFKKGYFDWMKNGKRTNSGLWSQNGTWVTIDGGNFHHEGTLRGNRIIGEHWPTGGATKGQREPWSMTRDQ